MIVHKIQHAPSNKFLEIAYSALYLLAVNIESSRTNFNYCVLPIK